MKVKKQRFGVLPNGKKVYLYTIKNSEMSFSVTNFGCTITSICLPPQNGAREEITLGYSDLAGYIRHPGTYFGAFVGRVANRIANGRFVLNGVEYCLDKNNGENTLHGGFDGYDKMLWDAVTVETKEGTGVKFSRISRDGEQGFPGTVKIEVTYVLNTHNEIIMRYNAQTDKDTPLSLTNHTYFNLYGAGTILDHELTLNADSVLEVNDSLIPTGKQLDVGGTPFDFREPKKIGQDILKAGSGYDHNYCIKTSKGKLTICATVFEPVSGREMVVATNQPGVQFYSGNFLQGREGRLGKVYNTHDGFCLETQQFPDAPNHPEFPDSILRAGELFQAVTVYSFTW